MLICQDCHNKRQNRKALESQPLQYTGYNTFTRLKCAECDHKPAKNTHFYEYLSAYYIIQELDALKEKLKFEPVSFPFDFYETAEDMLQHKTGTFQAMSETEKQLLEYCAELENIIGKLEV